MAMISSVRAWVQRNRQARLVAATAHRWVEVSVSRLAAALSFYALLSLIPLLVTIHGLSSLVMDDRALASGMDQQIAVMIGPEQAAAVRAMLDRAQAPSLASLQAILGSLLTFATAAGVFIELKSSMDAIWQVPKREAEGWFAWIRSYFAPLTMVLGFAFLMLVSLFLDAVVSSAMSSFSQAHPGLLVGVSLLNQLVGWFVAGLLFAAIFRFLPAARLAWREVWFGAAVTATLFIIGKAVIGIYLGRSDFTGHYGPAGAVIAIIVWIYYSSQILFTGAVFTREHAQARAPSTPG